VASEDSQKTVDISDWGIGGSVPVPAPLDTNAWIEKELQKMHYPENQENQGTGVLTDEAALNAWLCAQIPPTPWPMVEDRRVPWPTTLEIRFSGCESGQLGLKPGNECLRFPDPHLKQILVRIRLGLKLSGSASGSPIHTCQNNLALQPSQSRSPGPRRGNYRASIRL
jgi:hypothetical protein